MRCAIVILLLLVSTAGHAQINCQRIGSQTFCSDGQSSTSIGQFDFYSNGGTGMQIGPHISPISRRHWFCSRRAAERNCIIP